MVKKRTIKKRKSIKKKYKGGQKITKSIKINSIEQGKQELENLINNKDKDKEIFLVIIN